MGTPIDKATVQIMNSDTDYTICNLDSPSYANSYSNSEIPASVYGYSTTISNRSIDTGQHYYGTENVLPPGLSGVDLTLGNTQAFSYPVNNNALARGSGRHPGFELNDGTSHLVDPYLNIGPTGLALNGDSHLAGGVPLSPGRTAYGGVCVENIGPCAMPNGVNTYIPHSAPSPVKVEPQNLQAKPFRWMQIKRNAAKPGK